VDVSTPLVGPKSDLPSSGGIDEQSDDVVFTIEYSVRSAMTAVYKLLNLDKQPPPVYKGWRDPRVVYRVFQALLIGRRAIRRRRCRRGPKGPEAVRVRLI
jgi:myosin-crossreactive antigen